MRPPRINQDSSFGPGVLNVVSQAFDEAWAAIEAGFSSDEHESTREILAQALMASAGKTAITWKDCVILEYARCI